MINLKTYPNGLKVITEEIPYVNTFSIGMCFKTGSRKETRKLNGISHFVEHMIFKGTKKRNTKKITDEIESIGGYLNAFTTKEYTCFYAKGLNGNLNKTFEVLSDIIQHPVFDPKEIKKESGVIRDEILDYEDSPEDFIFDRFETEIYKGNSLAYPVLGTIENVAGFAQKDLKNFVKDNYGINNLIISVAGNIKEKAVFNLVPKFINDLPYVKSKNGRVLKNISPHNSFIQKKIQQSHIIIGKPVVGYNNKSRNIVRLLSIILGEGSSSRLFQTLREKNGIAYQIQSFLNSYRETSAFGIYVSTNNKVFPKAVDLIYKELNKLKQKKVSEKELKRAKEYLKGSIVIDLESTSNRMIRWAQSTVYFNRIKPVQEVLDEIDNVTREQILEQANVTFNETDFFNVLLSPNNSLGF